MKKQQLAILTTILGLASSTFGAVNLIADPAYSGLITGDPELSGPAQRGIAVDRHLRQTFVLGAGLNVDSIQLSIKLAGGTGADPSAATWVPGTLIKSLSIGVTETLPSSSARIGLNLTDGDIFTLPAGNYGIEVSNGDDATTIGSLRHSNSGVDTYTDGRFYIENGNPSNSNHRDFGVAISGTAIPEPASALLGALGLLGLLRRRR
jgi:hypothetical protein